MLRLVFAALLVSWSVPALAADCTLLATDRMGNADLVVFFTRFAKEDKTEGRYKTCRLVKEAEDGTQSFFVTAFRQDANVVVHRGNWPKR